MIFLDLRVRTVAHCSTLRPLQSRGSLARTGFVIVERERPAVAV
jgi:hypothetical protein